MKRVDVVQLTRDAIAQTMGTDYLPAKDGEGHDIPNGQLGDLSSEKLADVGRGVTTETVINRFANNLIAVSMIRCIIRPLALLIPILSIHIMVRMLTPKFSMSAKHLCALYPSSVTS